MSSKKSYQPISTKGDNNKASEVIEAKLDLTGFDSTDIMNDKARGSKSCDLTNEANHSIMHPIMETYELPRDILTAYILIHLENDGKTNLWSKYNVMGKLGIIFSLITSFAIQFFVAISLIINIDWSDADQITDVDTRSIFSNVISLSVLFIYMLRDLHGYSSTVWKFIARVEEEQKVEFNPFHNYKSRIKHIGKGKAFKRWDYYQLDPRQIDVNKQKTRFLFLHFRILIFCIFVIYAMLTFYSLVQIAVTEGLTEKLEVSLAIFFLLEVDDWSYQLFFLQNGVLQDEMFDVTFPIQTKGQQSKFQRDTRNVWCSLFTVYGSLAFVIIYSYLYNPCNNC